ncbi:FAD-dependent monooxygenase [Actinacidiphila sp. DG2A-62]|uniref:FAD-dependent monooxygenase n=1 Tax=Actinacidiphila sp. DG2A-62 TaxID=3108821 RepID=UPI002DB81CFC|nr:FAD-dependent monooxygenase [Actinacidiphila sp. DG2A-62]MEC3997096.1 FAD-dependent monooxygenase [Actinacidiphila sp. DG2A-62]
MRAVIVGGGIIGLTTAIALRRQGIEAMIHEQAPAIRAAGAGLGLWANAVAVFDELGLGEQVRAIGRPAEMFFRNHAGEVIHPSGYSDDNHRYLLVHRAKLNDLLAEAVGPDHIRLDSRLVGYDETDTGVTAHFGDGTRAGADLLVGADGVYSIVRSLLLPGSEAVEHKGHHAWRAVVPPPAGTTIDRSVIVLGEERTRGGYVPTADGTVYWLVNQFGVDPLHGTPKEQAAERAAFLDTTGWNPALPALIASTPDEQVLHNQVMLVPPLARWVSQRVVLARRFRSRTFPAHHRGCVAGCGGRAVAGPAAHLLRWRGGRAGRLRSRPDPALPEGQRVGQDGGGLCDAGGIRRPLCGLQTLDAQPVAALTTWRTG